MNSYPPELGLPEFCELCGFLIGDDPDCCCCPACKVCGGVGDPSCLELHGLKVPNLNNLQRAAQRERQETKRINDYYAKMAARDDERWAAYVPSPNEVNTPDKIIRVTNIGWVLKEVCSIRFRDNIIYFQWTRPRSIKASKAGSELAHNHLALFNAAAPITNYTAAKIKQLTIQAIDEDKFGIIDD